MPSVRSQAAYISPTVLQWARKRARLSIEALSSKAHVRPDSLKAWESGIEQPSFRQAEHIAGALHVPFGYLFLASPPKEEIPLPDFRVGKNWRDNPSPELLDLLNDVSVKQQWYREYLMSEHRKPLPFVGKFKPSDAAVKVAEDIRNTLGLTLADRDQCPSWEDFLRAFIRGSEAAGIVVMKSGIVGGNPHRTLDVNEFRGFTISDSLAPLIFINGVDTKAAQIFTLAHELAHVWFGASGISNEQLDEFHAEDKTEEKCNEVAAEVLVPVREFRWNSGGELTANLSELSKRFKVSTLVILRRAVDLGVIDKDTFISEYRNFAKRFRDREEAQSEGGNFFPTLFSRNSNTFTRAVMEALGEGRTLYREAAQLLNVKVPTLRKVSEYIEARS